MIIGIAGTNGAGKGTVVAYLVEKGFTHYSVSRFIAEEVRRRDLPLNRPMLGAVGDDLRKLHGADYVIRTFVAQAAGEGRRDIIVESIRNSIEVESVKKHGGFTLVVDADRKTRYRRVKKRGSEKDAVSFKHFCANEDREMTSGAAHEMDMRAVMARGDFHIDNNGTPEELRAQIDSVLKQIKR